MDIDRYMAKRNFDKGKTVFFKKMSGMDPYLECKKWLKYIPKFQKKRMDELNKKIVKDLSIEELDEIREYKYQEKMANLFEIYDTKKSTPKEKRKFMIT